MTLLVIAVWTCEKCHCVCTIPLTGLGPFDDPVMAPPKGWDYGKDENTHMCPACLNRENVP